MRLKELKFLVKWEEFDEESNTWEPWKNLRKLEPLHRHLREQKAEYLIPKAFQSVP